VPLPKVPSLTIANKCLLQMVRNHWFCCLQPIPLLVITQRRDNGGKTVGNEIRPMRMIHGIHPKTFAPLPLATTFAIPSFERLSFEGVLSKEALSFAKVFFKNYL
jgi:hypothetical protein